MLRARLIRLAQAHPELRQHLVPLLRQGSDPSKHWFSKGWVKTHRQFQDMVADERQVLSYQPFRLGAKQAAVQSTLSDSLDIFIEAFAGHKFRSSQGRWQVFLVGARRQLAEASGTAANRDDARQRAEQEIERLKRVPEVAQAWSELEKRWVQNLQQQVAEVAELLGEGYGSPSSFEVYIPALESLITETRAGADLIAEIRRLQEQAKHPVPPEKRLLGDAKAAMRGALLGGRDWHEWQAREERFRAALSRLHEVNPEKAAELEAQYQRQRLDDRSFGGT